MLSGSGTGGAGGDVRLCSGKSETGASCTALIKTATGHMSGAIKIAGGSGLRHQSGDYCIQTKEKTATIDLATVSLARGRVVLAGSGQVNLNAGTALVGEGGV